MKIARILFWILVSHNLVAQTRDFSEIPSTVRKGVIYKTEWSLDVGLHTNGYFIGYNRGKIRSFHTTRYTHFDMGFLFHPKETRSSRPNSAGFKSFNAYKFGKENQLINLRLGRGILRTLSEKARTRGIAVGLRMEGGLSLGLQKPYYLKIADEADGRFTIKEIRYEDQPDDFLDPNHILGSARFFKGLNKISLVPGAYGRLGVRLDPGAFELMVRSLEAGLQLDLYSRRPDLMIHYDNPYAYLNLYVVLQLGKRKS